MPSTISKTIIPNDKGFSSNFDIIKYSSELTNSPILDIWKDIQIKIAQEEKQSTFLYWFHNLKRSDSLEGISFQYYQVTNYWWLVLLVNNQIDPFDFFDDMLNDDSPIKILKPQYFTKVLGENTSNDLTKYFNGDNNAS